MLRSSNVVVDGELFMQNFVNKPFFIVNGGRDPLYPAHVAEIYAKHLQTLGGTLIFRVYPESDHSTAWWPEERGAFEAFPRDARFPRRLPISVAYGAPLPIPSAVARSRDDQAELAVELMRRIGALCGAS